jgi:hypothetical protein
MKLKATPSVVQLPGGIRLTSVPFKILDYHEDGSPKTFEILPPGTKAACYLFADEKWLRSPIGSAAAL